jgi:hypothetical protein
MTPFRRPVRILRNLRIEDVSSVDEGAGRGVKVVLTKRNGEEVTYTTSQRTPDMTTAPATIAKATENSINAIAERLQKRNPGLSWGEAVQQAISDPSVSDLVRAERDAKFGKAYEPSADRRRSPDPVRVEQPVPDSSDVLARLAKEHMAANPGVTYPQAIVAASAHPDFIKARARDLQRLTA